MNVTDTQFIERNGVTVHIEYEAWPTVGSEVSMEEVADVLRELTEACEEVDETDVEAELDDILEGESDAA